MRRSLLILALLWAGSAAAQTTTFNGVIKDLSNTPVPTGQVLFNLKPSVDTTTSGSSRFVPVTTICEIHNPAVVSTSGTGTITVVVGTAQTWQVGDSLIFVGTADATLNGSTVATPYTITQVNSTTSFNFTQSGTHTNGAGGTVGGLYKTGGTGACAVMQNSAITPTNTSYLVSIQPLFSPNPSSSFNTYAIGPGPVDITTVVPTPAQMPAYSFVDTFSNQTIGGNKTFTGNNPLTGINTISNLNGDVYLDGVKYVNFAAALAAVTAGGTLRISAGTYTTGNSTLNLVSGLDIECDPNNLTILQAGATLNAAMFTGTSISNVRMAGCVIDGNRSNNANLFGALSLTGVTKSKVIGNHFQNFSGGRIVYLSSGSNFNAVQDNEIDHYGASLPAVANGNECIALAPSGSGAGVQDNDIIHNYCHDGNGGIAIYNSNAPASVTANSSRNRFLYNKVQAMANDAFLIFSSPTANPVGSLIQGNLWDSNIARCNGWPANGAGWDSTNCPPGLLQTGSFGGQGVGFNLNSNQSDQNQFIGNRSEFNFFEGGDDTPQIISTVSTSNGALGGCSSNCVQASSGGCFLTTWKTNSGIIINGSFFLISSVQSCTVLTLTTAPGTQTNVQSDGFTFSRSIWKGNYFFNNGNGAPAGGQGAGLAIQGGYVVSSGNISAGNAYSGFYDTGAVYVTHSGDHSLFNCRVSACNEFNAQAALRPHYEALVSDSAGTNNALFFSAGTNNGYAEAAALCNANGCGSTVVQDQGTNDDFFDGKNRGSANTNGATHTICWGATGGLGCLNYGGGSGSFSDTLPGVSGTLLSTGTANLANPLQTQNTSTCSTTTTQFSTCNVTVTWATAFVDANYKYTCSLVNPNVAGGIAQVGTPVAASVVVTVINFTSGTAVTSGTVSCVAIHN